MRRWTGTAVAAAVLLGGSCVLSGPAAARQPVAAPTAPQVPLSQEPVLFVHGVFGKASEGDALVAYFHANTARPARTVPLPGPDGRESNDNLVNAVTIKAAVDAVRAETGAEKVNLVVHSMGGLATRHYIRFLGGADAVRSYVGMGTPEHGTEPGSPLEPWVCLLGPKDGGQMCRDGYRGRDNLFLRELNAGDESFGPVGYTVLRSTAKDGDGPVTSRLTGGACHHEIPGVRHSKEPGHPAFLDAARRALDGDCPGTWLP